MVSAALWLRSGGRRQCRSVGNIWRFPYLCAKDGGGLFLLVYLVLVLTFGFTLLTTDVAIGRRTKQNALNASGLCIRSGVFWVI